MQEASGIINIVKTRKQIASMTQFVDPELCILMHLLPKNEGQPTYRQCICRITPLSQRQLSHKFHTGFDTDFGDNFRGVAHVGSEMKVDFGNDSQCDRNRARPHNDDKVYLNTSSADERKDANDFQAL